MTVVARALGIPPERVHVQSTRIGGGFGRRLLSDYAAEAAVVSRAIGAPVQIVDSRTGDLQHDYYRPMAIQRLRAGLDASGRIDALGSRHRQRVEKRVSPRSAAAVFHRDVRFIHRSCHDTRAARSGPRPDPDPHARLRYGALRTGVPTGAWRAPSHVAVAFAIESTIDELASIARRSAVDMRLEILGELADVPKDAMEPTPYDPSRMARVIRAAAGRGGFGQRQATGRARGFAAHYTFGGYCGAGRRGVGG